MLTHQRFSEKEHDVIDAAGVKKTGELLDIGCGTGSFFGRLRQRGHVGRLCELDASPAAVEAAGQVAGVEPFLGDAVALPFVAGQFDVVAARHVLYRVDDPLAAVGVSSRGQPSRCYTAHRRSGTGAGGRRGYRPAGVADVAGTLRQPAGDDRRGVR